MRNVALITGASSGIGKELAKIHAARGGDLVIVAKNKEGLELLKFELENLYKTNVKVISKDLNFINSAKEIYEEVKSNGIEIDCLINNAGFGGQGKFYEQDWERNLAMINVNIISLASLTRFFLPDFVKRNNGKILNVSSTAAFMPGPLQAVYFATKAFVLSFSNAIAEELSDTEVTVTTLLPGPTNTEFAKTAQVEKTILFAKMFAPEIVAKAGYDGMISGKLNVIAGVNFSQKLMFALIPFVPKKFLLKQVHKMQEVKA